MPGRAVLAMGVLALGLAATGRAVALTGGAPDAGAHPYVAMISGVGASGPSCTGVLVAADNGALEVLTVAHCLYQPGSPRTGTNVQVEFGDTFSPNGPFYSGTYVVSDAYNPNVSQAHDLAAVVLSSSPGITPAALGAVGQEDARPDTALTTVGTGKPYAGQRRYATETLTGRDATWLYLRAGNGNSCDGDSGGPDLVPGTSTVVALTDVGSCSTDQDLRVDTTEAHRFLVKAAETAGAPVVTTQPSDQTVPGGSTAQFSAAAAGSPAPTTQWQRSADGGATFADVAGATGATLTVTPAPGESGDRYRAVFTNSLATAVSDPATLTVTSAQGSGTAGLYHPVVPHRIVDTRLSGGPVSAGADRQVPVLGSGGVPTSGVAAVVLATVVAVPAGAGDLEVYPTGAKPANRTSNLNWPAHRTVANLVTVPVGTGGTVALSVNAGSVDVALDVVGWYGDSTNQSGLRYTAFAPVRVLDTGQSGMGISSGVDRRVQLRGVGGVPDRPDVVAVLLNLTVLGSSSPADVQVYPTGAAPAVRTSNTNLVPGQTAAVAVNAVLGSDGSATLSLESAQPSTIRAVVDVAGYYSASGDRFVPMTPVRVVDRAGVTAGTDTPLILAGRDGIPSDASAVVANLTGLGASRGADVSVYPVGQRPAQRTSVLNLLPGEAVPNLLVAGLASGGVDVSASGGTLSVIVDATGYLTSH